MRRHLLIQAVLLTTLGAADAGAQTVVPASGRRQGVNSQRMNAAYSRRNEVTIAGTITGKVKGTAPGQPEGVAILVRDARNHVNSVDLGPSWFVGRQATALKVGDKVRVTGSPVRYGARDRVVLARRVQRGRQLLTLRDSNGTPYWDAFRRSRVAVTSGNRELNGSIASMNTTTIDGQSYQTYVLQTNNGPVTVAVAPDWYLRQQSLGFNVGDTVSVITPSSLGPNGVYVANSVYGPAGGLAFYPGVERAPAWSGFGILVTGGGFAPGFTNGQPNRP